MWFCFQSPINSQVKFLTLQLHPQISGVQGSVGQGEVRKEGSSGKASRVEESFS